MRGGMNNVIEQVYGSADFDKISPDNAEIVFRAQCQEKYDAAHK